jgi:hypothetical protein
MLLAVLMLSFGLSQANDSVAVWVYDVTADAVLDPATDTIYTADVDGNPLSYQYWIGLENDHNLGGISLGFRMWSDDGAEWQWDAQPDGWGPGGQGAGLAAVTIIPTSRLFPIDSAFDMTKLLVSEKSMDGLSPDTIVIGGVSMFQTFEIDTTPGPDPCLAFHFTPKAVGYGIEKTLCIDSTFVPPAGNFVFVDMAGSTFVPDVDPALCFPVATLDPNGAEGDKPLVPYTFDLGQNYPNPFNPNTVINYSVEHKTEVEISVLNILGQHVATLVNEEMDAGVYQVVWDGNDENGDHVASGIYFYKMITEDFIETRKMVLMR